MLRANKLNRSPSLTQATDAGGFPDIALDFVFYASIPLAFAVMAAKRGLGNLTTPNKSF